MPHENAPDAQVEQYNCKLCHQPDVPEMVACDNCETWFHFQCVNVDSTVNDRSWICETCRTNPNQSPHSTPRSTHSNEQAQSKASKSRKRRDLLFKRLEEEKQLREANNQRYLSDKYKALEEFTSSDEEEEKDQGKSVDCSQLTQMWVEQANTRAPLTGALNSTHKLQPAIKSVPESQKQSDPCNSKQVNSQPPQTQTQIQSEAMITNLQPDNPSTQFESRQANLILHSQLAARQAISKDLPFFYGNPEEWPIFISSFEHSTSLAGYTQAENLMRLQKCLRGSALEAVKNRLLLPTMVPEIIRTLRMRFGRPEHILHAMIAKAKNQAPPKADKMETLIEYALAIQNVCATMEASQMTAHLNNPILLKEFVDKLTPHLLLNWALFAKELQQPTLPEFSKWLSEIAEAACSVTTPTVRQTVEKRDRRSNHLCTHDVADFPVSNYRTNSGPRKCYLCSSNHELVACNDFKQAGRSDRWNIVRKYNLCHTCLTKHPHSRCKISTVCGIDGCALKHNQLLHNNAGASDVRAGSSRQQSGYSTLGCHSDQKDNRYRTNVLFSIIPVTLYGNNKLVDTFAFLDGGSSLTLVDEELADDLNLPGRPEELCLRWTSETTRVEKNSRIVTLGISGCNEGSQRFTLRNARTVQGLGLPMQSVSSQMLKSRYPYMNGLPIPSYQWAQPRILIGMDNWKLGIPLKVFEGNWSQPMATKTRLGWCVHGPEKENTNERANLKFILNIHQTQSDAELHQLVEKFFSIENIGIRIPTQQLISTEEKRAIKILEDSCVRVGKQFETGLLWKFDTFSLPDSYHMAFRRFQLLDQKIQRDVQLSKNLNEQISNLVVKGYAKKLSAEELGVNGHVWYLPIFIVRNPNKPAKVRLVWDAAAKCDGVSLNDFLLKGPDQLVPITSVLYGFRCGRFAVCGDIAEMFHQVRVRKSDRSVQRFLWRDEMNKNKPSVYEMQALTFGATCSPCIAHYVKNQNAMSFTSSKPRAVEAILQHHYVDDFIDSTDTIDEAIQLAKDVKFIHANAGFNIRNWMSNSPTVLKVLQEDGERSNTSKAFGMNDTDMAITEKVLGMHWNTSVDTFTYVLNFNSLNRKVLSEKKVPTKREVLKILMSIFDPMGFLSHFLVFVKILLQDIWRMELDWDEELPVSLYERWLRWQMLLPRVTELQIPRCYSFNLTQTGTSIQLHTFVDASENAYAAVSYFRIANGNQIETTIVSAKTKVAPRRPLSIPRLELQAAVLGVRLMNSICNAHSFSIGQRFLWSDSKTVLSWLRTDPRNFQQFVMYRVGEILESSNIMDWKWIPSKLNVADKATKWNSDPDWDASDEWFKGPAFLHESPKEWPQMPTIQLVDKNEFRPHLLQINEVKTAVKLIDVNRFGTWRKLWRSVAYVFMYIENLKLHVKKRKLGNTKGLLDQLKLNIEKWDSAKMKDLITQVVISSAAIRKSQMLLYRQSQSEVYLEEINIFKKNNGRTPQMPKKSALRKLSPFLDENGLLRMQGRIAFADFVTMDCRTPIILPNSSYVTFLIVDAYHCKYHHLNHETVLNEVWQKFYISKPRVLLKSVRKDCQVCKIQRACPRVPEMANLPRARLGAFFKPFSFVGVDFFGPITVTVGRRNEKRWGALFTCLTIRAVHIEVAHSLTTDSFIMCLRNFIARRGTPLEIYSDNGTNFRGAEKVLRDELKKVDLGQVANEFMTAELKWRFNPPSAPHMGGAWERLVRSMKTVLYQILPSTKIGDESLRCALIEVEHVINSRPLTFVSLDSADDEALTPNHFLLGTSNGTKPPCDSQNFDLRKSWKQSQMLAELFWKKWVQAFLPTLNRRSKWFSKVKPIAKGDLVVIVDNDLPRNCWPKGRVVDVVIAKDGQVRRAKVQTKSGLYERPAAKLAVLDVTGREQGSKADADCSQLTGGGMLTPSSRN